MLATGSTSNTLDFCQQEASKRFEEQLATASYVASASSSGRRLNIVAIILHLPTYIGFISLG